jgi:hypothetical protein
MKTELGYYTVNKKVFANKISAILEAQLTNSEIEWNYFDELFNKVDWLNEPLPSLDEMYKARALQIREKYDYVILRCSGGADSNNVLYTFLNNGIHIDEVVAEIPMSGLKNWEFNTSDKRHDNSPSEFKYAQLPLLHEIATKYPKVKITMLDMFEDMIAEGEGGIVNQCQDIINLYVRLQSKMERLPHVKDLAELGKKIAVVSGTDKPVLAVLPDGNVYTIIADQAVNVPAQPFNIPYPNVDRVLFYWTHEMPELLAKMSHVVAREIHKPENARIYQAMMELPKRYYTVRDDSKKDEILNFLLNKYKLGYDKKIFEDTKPFTIYERGIVPFIYPSTWKPDLFQVDKNDPSIVFLGGQEWVRLLHPDTVAVKAVESEFKELYKKLSAKYLNPGKTGFKKYMKMYKLGSAEHFKKQN